MTPRPPRWAAFIVAALTVESDRDEVLGDLEERFRRLARTRPRAATRWYWWQVIRSVPRLAWARVLPALDGPSRHSRGATHGRSPRAAARKGEGWMSSTLQDLVRATRTLARTPSFTVVAIVTLALGLGANTAVFTVFDSVLLRPLPYPEPDRLVRLTTGYEWAPDARNVLSGPDFVAWRDGTDAFEQLAVLYTYRERGLDLTDGDRPRRVRALPVSSGYFETYRAAPLFGRTFTQAEEHVDARVAVLSHALWQSYADGRRDIVGAPLTMDGEPYTVIGVMPASFLDVVAGDVELWIPQDLQPDYTFNGRGNTYLTGIGRLAPGVSLVQAQAQLDAVSAGLAERFPDTNGERFGRIYPMFEEVVGHSRTLLYVLMGASGLVLLLACVNVANLFLARGVVRQREMAVRAAIGAGRGRLARQLLSEGFVLAAGGAVVGLLVAYAGVRLLPILNPESLPRAAEVAFDPSLVGFVLSMTLLTGLLFGLGPSLWASRAKLGDALRDSTRGTTGGIRGGRARNVLIACQMSLALMLLIGAGLLMRSFVSLLTTDLGVRTENVLTFEVHLPVARYADGSDRIAFHQALQERLGALSGVRSIGATSWLPVSGRYHNWGVSWRGEGEDVNRERAQIRVIEGDYFETMGIELRGRAFRSSDDSASARVAIVSQSVAERAFPDGDALGREVASAGSWRTVVGIASDVSVDHRGSFLHTVYIPHSEYGHDRNWALIQVVATEPGHDDVLPAIRRELARVDPNLVVYHPRPMGEVAGRQVARDRFALSLMAIFAGVALALAAVGVYGILSYSVSQRTQEIGIRMALGARQAQVRRSVLAAGTRLAAVGIAIGLLGAWGLSRFLESLLFSVGVRDPLIFVAVPLALGLVALVAGYVPARRATRVDPVRALHGDGA